MNKNKANKTSSDFLLPLQSRLAPRCCSEEDCVCSTSASPVSWRECYFLLALYPSHSGGRHYPASPSGQVLSSLLLSISSDCFMPLAWLILYSLRFLVGHQVSSWPYSGMGKYLIVEFIKHPNPSIFHSTLQDNSLFSY